MALLIAASVGVACLLLAGFGVIDFGASSRRATFAPGCLQNLPLACAVTNLRGRVLWNTARFAKLVPLTGAISDLTRLGDGVPEVSNAMFRMFQAARRRQTREELLSLSVANVTRRINLTVFADFSAGVHTNEPLLLWVATDGSATSMALLADQSDRLPARSPSPVKPSHAAPAGVTLAALLSTLPTAAATIAPGGRISSMNAAFVRLTRLRDDAASIPNTVTISDLFTDTPTLAELSVHLSAMPKRKKRQGAALEVDATLKNAVQQCVKLTLVYHEPTGETLLYASEVADTPQINEQAMQNHKMQAVGELAGGIAHDFNNLLTAIIGFSDLLLTRFRASDPAFKDIMNIKNNANRAAELVRQILAYSRQQTLRPTLVSLTDVIEDFHASVGRLLGEKIKARIVHERDLWDVKADEGQLFQVIMNLAVNARDAMPDGGELLIRTANISSREAAELKTEVLPRGEYVLCEVRDTGVGIASGHLRKIFDPFFSTKEVGKGTGLGLSTVYGIVKQTGGAILVDSVIGRGTCFSIYLPRYVQSQDEDAKLVRSKGLDKAAPSDLTGSATILLVEDEDTVRSFASRALSTRGYTVLEASTGVEALEVMDRAGVDVDLVLSDVVMPEMDGPTLLKHLRERNPLIKIVFMSGYAEEAFRKNLNADEQFIFLPKPFTLKKLAETVKAASLS